jgi:hypothetical protein
MPNEMPDGPDKTNWGKEQVNWFQQTYKASYVTFKILISPTPIMQLIVHKKEIIIPIQILNMREI